MTEKAVWSTAFINDLPDAAFAWIEPGGKKDSSGKTTPRSLRHLPHHNASVKSPTENGSVDKPHLRAALSRVNQIPQAGRATAQRHLQAHAKAVLGPKDHEMSEDFVRKDINFELLSLDEDGRSLRMVASTSARDSYGDIVQQNWDLSHFEKNPAVLYGHNKAPGAGIFGGGGGAMLPEHTIPVGYSKAHGVVGGRLEFEPVFSDERANPMAERVWQGIRQKVLRAASVGFRPGKIIREEDANGVETYYVGTPDQPNILKEISIVPLGANHEAVGLDHESGPQIARLWALREKQEPDMPNEPVQTTQDPTPELTTPTTNEQLTLPSIVDAKALEDRAAKAERELADAKAKLEKHEAELAKSQVEALMGKKLVPAQRDDFVELRIKMPELFGRITASLPDLKLADDVTGPAPIDPSKDNNTNETADERAARKLRG
jgi:hypothetical protein